MENTENMENLENEITEVQEEQGTESLGEGQTEIRQGIEEVLDETEYDDEIETQEEIKVVTYEEDLALIIEELIAQRQELDTLQEYLEYQNQSIFEKPLEEYNTTESLLLIALFVVVFGTLIKLIGGIITCKV